MDELFTTLPTTAWLAIALAGFVFTCFRVVKTHWETKKIRLEVAELTRRISEENVRKSERMLIHWPFTKADAFFVSLLVLDLIWISLRIATDETISRGDLILAVWLAAFIALWIAFLLFVLAMYRITGISRLLMTLIEVLFLGKQKSDNAGINVIDPPDK